MTDDQYARLIAYLEGKFEEARDHETRLHEGLRNEWRRMMTRIGARLGHLERRVGEIERRLDGLERRRPEASAWWAERMPQA